MASRSNYDEDDEEELGAYIYQSSHTAKLFREKAALEALISNPTSQQTQRKSSRLATKNKEQHDIRTTALPETPTIVSNIYTKQRAKCKRKSAVLKKEDNIIIKQGRVRKNYICRYLSTQLLVVIKIF